MATRGGIARIENTQPDFTGVYHHWDSYPSGLGATLWHLYRGYFGKNLRGMLKYLIDDHPAGWSTINDCDFSLKPGYVEYDNPLRDALNGPRCFCHGDRNDEGMVLNTLNAGGAGCEYIYAFREPTNTMHILSSYATYDGKEVKMIGMFGFGDPESVWKTIAVIDLDDDEEPDWGKIGE